MDILTQAQTKLAAIIAREGDANGERLEGWYFEMMVEDVARSRCMEGLYDGRKKK